MPFLQQRRRPIDLCHTDSAMTLEIQNAVAATFAGHLNSKFRVLDEPPTELELVDVSDGSTPHHINFSLLFRGPLQPLLPQRIYPVEHDRLGRFDLFIVPVRRDTDGLYYEAVFNRTE
jgi:Domain of unknown function (DUF6916)